MRPLRNRREGATTVELAMVAPALFLILFAFVEFGRAIMVLQTMEEAARTACRAAVVDGAVAATIESEAEDILESFGTPGAEATVSPSPLDAVAQWAPITVTLEVDYADVSFLPLPSYLGDLELDASCTLPREASPASDDEE